MSHVPLLDTYARNIKQSRLFYKKIRDIALQNLEDGKYKNFNI